MTEDIRDAVPGEEERAPVLPPPADQSAPAAKAPRPRWVFRWVALVGVVLMGLSIVAWEAADHDPMIGVAITSDDGHGHCRGSWTAPGEYVRRTTDFACDVNPSVEGFGVGRMVADGPWKGDLYNSEGEGTPAHTVYDVVGMTGLGLVAVAVVGGTVRRIRARRRREQARHEELLSRASVRYAFRGSASRSYAVLAAAAERQGAIRRPPSAKGAARTAPWWRIGPLLRVSSVLNTAVSGAIAVMGAVVFFASGESRLVLAIIAALNGFTALRLLLFHVPAGVVAVRLFSRASQAPVGRSFRYVLLHSRTGPQPEAYLVLYHPHGTLEDEPIAVLPLAPTGTTRSREPDPGLLTRIRVPANLPAPTGTAELHGWLDQDAEGDPLVVPFIEGRPYWPLTPLRQSGPRFAELCETVRGLSLTERSLTTPGR
ncbi:hypothetical protein ACFQLX_03850 [Streptomyces polyrhachis]|uniref:DUF3592 domain-containing protein n=1 Tax=Streptomyces polyrhachis TaxID=1282885 RepID=A0ABW2GC00_9ACTN